MKGAGEGLGRLLRLRFALEHAVLRVAVAVIPRLPLGFVRTAAEVLGTLAWLVDGRGRAAGRMNLEVVYGEAMGERGRGRLLRRCYRRFAVTFAEFFWSPRLTEEGFDRWFEFEWDTPEAERACLEGECVFATAHFGNFEWLSLGRALRSSPCMIIAQDFKNPPLTELFRELRSQNGRQTIIPQEGAMLKLFKHLKRGGCAAALVDLNVPPDQAAVPVRMFGRWVSISVLHCALAARTGKPLVPALALPGKDGRWRLRFFEPFLVGADEDYQVVAQRCWDVFEPVFREHPECWMWMYKHWRYLPVGAREGEYPAYANRSKKFDRLLSGR
ncbi:MAG: Lauroyl/myristoyl acyltransferase [Verrucomicrobia bacterium]|nr:MAG: Lauroyl/myristoyl acyltransferase [Verrucomicrobiota bacterium]